MTPEKKRTVKEKAKDVTIITSVLLALTQGGYQQFIKEPADIKEQVKIEVAEQMKPVIDRVVLLEKNCEVLKTENIGTKSALTDITTAQRDLNQNIILILNNKR
jgi:hypothetical protein